MPSCRAVVVVAASLLVGCAAGIRDDVAPPAPTYANAPATSGRLAAIARELAAAHGPDASGVKLLDVNSEALQWRLALIDSAVSSLEVQTYLWYPDVSGRLVLERAVLAARRGVRVRLLVDDLLTDGEDQVLADLQNQPNLEIRLFNPWTRRGLAGRAGQMITRMERLNTRMHNKMMIADGHAAIIGGRNIGDHYFGLSHDYNFHDLDVLGFGRLARQGEEMFDEFWNSEWTASAANLTTAPSAAEAAAAWNRLQEANRSAVELARFSREPSDWTDELEFVVGELDIGTSEVVFDSVADDEVAQTMLSDMAFLFRRAERELLVTNAYIIPSERSMAFLAGITTNGVDVRILTNSLESHDVPAVNSHYQRWRDDLISQGAQLFETRADANLRAVTDVPPVAGRFIGLHTKAAVVDREQVFVGSMNLDPRSSNINTEMGIVFTSPGLAEKLAAIMLRDMGPENAWQVHLDDRGNPYWVNSDRTVTKQPARGGGQRLMNAVFRLTPKRQL